MRPATPRHFSQAQPLPNPSIGKGRALFGALLCSSPFLRGRSGGGGRRQRYAPQASYCQRGFTLIELLVVLTLIGLIAGTVGPNFFEAAQRMSGKNEAQQIRQQVNGLPLAALHAGEALQINQQGAPFALPEGWKLTAKQPVVYQPNGVCRGGTLELWQGKQRRQITLQAPFCQWVDG